MLFTLYLLTRYISLYIDLKNENMCFSCTRLSIKCLRLIRLKKKTKLKQASKPKNNQMTLTVYLVFALNVSIVFYVLYVLFGKSRKKICKGSNADDRVPNGPSGLPVFGNLLQLGSRPYIKLFEWSENYGPIFRVTLGSQQVVVLNG
jgi:hypothetical protein